LRQAINADYDRLHNLANNHMELRKILGHGMIDYNDCYSLQIGLWTKLITKSGALLDIKNYSIV